MLIESITYMLPDNGNEYRFKRTVAYHAASSDGVTRRGHQTLEAGIGVSVVRKMCFLVATALGCFAAGGVCSAADLNYVSVVSNAAIHGAAYVKIGGIDQWITINGADRRNPVVLNLHGGPAVPSSPFTSPSIARLEKDHSCSVGPARGRQDLWQIGTIHHANNDRRARDRGRH